MLNSTDLSDDCVKGNQEVDLDRPIYTLITERIYSFFQETFSLYYKNYFKSTEEDMARRQRVCDEIGALHLLRSAKDQVQMFQEKRGYAPEENNFVNLCSIIVQQAGQALYTLFTMFLALLPAAVILLHVSHFLLDRLVDIVTTRRQSDLVYKGSIFTFQLIAILGAVHFLATSIFAPILFMQLEVFKKIAAFLPMGPAH